MASQRDKGKKSVPLSFDWQSMPDRQRAKIDADSASRALYRLAEFLAESSVMGRPATVPADLASWASEAIRSAMSKPKRNRARALTDAFGLTSGHKRPKADWLEVGLFLAARMAAGSSSRRAKEDAANKFDIDEKTAGRYWSQYIAARNQHDGIDTAEHV